MAITSNFEPYAPEESSKYPYLGKSKDFGFIVLFIEADCGTVLSVDLASCRKYKIGHYANNWYEGGFQPVQGIITIDCN